MKTSTLKKEIHRSHFSNFINYKPRTRNDHEVNVGVSQEAHGRYPQSPRETSTPLTPGLCSYQDPCLPWVRQGSPPEERSLPPRSGWVGNQWWGWGSRPRQRDVNDGHRSTRSDQETRTRTPVTTGPCSGSSSSSTTTSTLWTTGPPRAGTQGGGCEPTYALGKVFPRLRSPQWFLVATVSVVHTTEVPLSHDPTDHPPPLYLPPRPPPPHSPSPLPLSDPLPLVLTPGE